jgi:hypothetical protein
VSLLVCGYAASEKKLGENLREVSCFGKGRGFFSVGPGYLPTLEWTFNWLRRERDRQGQ